MKGEEGTTRRVLESMDIKGKAVAAKPQVHLRSRLGRASADPSGCRCAGRRWRCRPGAAPCPRRRRAASWRRRPCSRSSRSTTDPIRPEQKKINDPVSGFGVGEFQSPVHDLVSRLYRDGARAISHGIPVSAGSP